KVEIAYNTVDGTDWDGIQLSNARTGAKIHHNTVTNFGRINMGSQQAGIILGGNTNGDIYDNVVKNGTGNGIQAFGYGTIRIYNNQVENAGFDRTATGQESVYCNDHTNQVEANAKQEIKFYNNTIKNPQPRGAVRIAAYNNNSGPAQVTDNGFCITGAQADWEKKYIIVNPAGSQISNNTLMSNCYGTLPIILKSFAVSNSSYGITVTWKVSEELEVNSYRVERGDNGSDFTEINKIAPSAIGAQNEYSYTDRSRLNQQPQYYYRLCIEKKNGELIYSKIIALKTVMQASAINILNNPVVNNNLFFSVSIHESTQGKLEVINSAGQVVKQQAIFLTQGTSNQSIDVTALSKGIYNITIRDHSQLLQARFVKQ
ncbi:MAG TPA: T9SS type A sorting domain-containing protein, partial [Segetibacter sp.]